MRRNRRIWIGAIVLGAIVLLTLVFAPGSSPVSSGSTFNRAPNGYGAWYAYMQQQGVPIQRWQRSFNTFTEQGATFLQINPELEVNRSLDEREQRWVEKGNTLVRLGVRAPVTEAPFRTDQSSQQGTVTIDTARRRSDTLAQSLLGDRFGAVVWQETIGKGRLIQASTPHLAANAYQDEPGNFAFLAQLVKQNSRAVWVDEYLHGYKDASVATEEEGDLVSYLVKTPLVPILIQVGIILLVLVWAQNRRFGAPAPLVAPTIDNSEAYIQALASVLQKADRSEFVLNEVGKEEQRQIQQALGLGGSTIEINALLQAWTQQTGRPASELQAVLQPKFGKRRVQDTELTAWLEQVRSLHQQLPRRN